MIRARQKGFTLLELMIVLALVAGIAAIALPVTMGVLDRVHRQSAIREVTTALRFARSQAVTVKTAFAFQADLSENRFWLENLKTEQTSKVRSLAREIAFQEFFDGEDRFEDGIISIIFYPQGNTSGGSLTLAPKGDDSENRFFVEVDPVTGKPSVALEEE